MPHLTRRRSDNPHLVTWHVGDVQSAPSANVPVFRSTSIDGNGLAASILACILASITMG
jgi:hypothetical protein